MASEKFIKGKRDDANHDGAYSNKKRKDASDYELDPIGEQILASMEVYRQREKLPPELVKYHIGLLKAWGIL